jgi:predicted Rossmann fold nucleotide-binding protein DprA/Smf involved in DNA uptake
MTNYILPLDTQAILLLCASFGLSRTTEPKPLTLREYNNLVIWLKDNDLTPKDLLDSIIQNKLTRLVINQLESHRILALLKRGVMLSLAVEKWTNQGLWILSRSDAEYPKYLKQRLKHQAPAILYGVGNKKLLAQGGLAIVGSRDIDDAGLEYTQKLVETCVQQKIQIISGGARGVDQASMLGTIEAGGTVVGVMADSLAKAAVAKNYRRGIQEGRLTLISTYDPHAGFNVGNAMGRNKYIYALADYGLVVNSTLSKGGTWAGATEALKKIIDVPVFVRIEKNTNESNQKLIEQGAIPFPKVPCNIPLKVLMENRISDFKNIQTLKPIVIEQTSLLNCNKIAESNFSEKTTNILQAEVKNNSLVNKRQFKINNNQTQKKYNSQDIYEVVLPFILQKLEIPQNDQFLAESLDIQLGQMRTWLKRAVEEGEIKKNKKPVTYELNKTKNLSLLNN